MDHRWTKSVLTSRQNPLVKHFRKLHQPKYRRQTQTYLLEGTHLVEAALKARCPLQVCCHTPDWADRHGALVSQLQARAERLESVDPTVLATMASTQTPDGVIAIAPWPEATAPPRSWAGLGLGLESIQDPGNLGTILRSMAAVEGSGLLLSADCVALTNPKVLRASVGAWFQVPAYIPSDLPTTLAQYQKQGVQLVATSPTATQTYWDLDYRQPTLVLIGNEGAGLSAPLLRIAQQTVKIPMAAGTESLNAAIAAALILFEGYRQRTTA